ncbi:MAG: TetR/AcrR family transcriptional regulator [Bacillota bacterium]
MDKSPTGGAPADESTMDQPPVHKSAMDKSQSRRRRRGRPPFTPEEVAAHRYRILGAAVEVFAWYGYEATTLAAVAEAAGISQGLILRYFESKASLFIEAIREGLVHFQAVRQSALAPAGPPPERLRRWADAMVRSQEEAFSYSRLVMQVLGAPGAHPPECLPMVLEFGETEAGWLRHLLVQAGRPEVRAWYHAWLAVSTLWGSRMVMVRYDWQDPMPWPQFLYEELCRQLEVPPDPRPEPTPLPSLPWQPPRGLTPWSRPESLRRR